MSRPKSSKKRAPKIQYGKSYRYTSTEQAIRDLTRLEKKQREEQEKKKGGDT